MDKTYVAWIGCVLDGCDHAVTQHEQATGIRRADGRYQAVCGHVVIAAPMLQPPGAPCRACHAALRPRSILPNPDDRPRPRGHRRAGWLRRWLVLHDAPAGSGDAPTVPVPAGSQHARRGA